jgi:hypothetical protein
VDGGEVDVQPVGAIELADGGEACVQPVSSVEASASRWMAARPARAGGWRRGVRAAGRRP